MNSVSDMSLPEQISRLEKIMDLPAGPLRDQQVSILLEKMQANLHARAAAAARPDVEKKTSFHGLEITRTYRHDQKNAFKCEMKFAPTATKLERAGWLAGITVATAAVGLGILSLALRD